MRTLDIYVAKNFLIGWLIMAFVMIGLCTVVDLFLNLDEFVEHSDMGTSAVLFNIFDFYRTQSTLWFRDLSGIITVTAAVFSLARMTYNNELIAIMASGVSLKRVIAPIILLSILSMGLLVIDQEFIIPDLAHKLIRSHDYAEGTEEEDILNLWFMSDHGGDALVCSKEFKDKDDTLVYPTIFIRKRLPGEYQQWKVVNIIRADKAVYNKQKGGWDLVNGRYERMGQSFARLVSEGRFDEIKEPEKVDFYESTLTPFDIPLKLQEGYKSYLSSKQLTQLSHYEKRQRDTAELYLQKHSRVTDPIMNLVMLMIALPILVCRDPKTMKTAIMKCFALSIFCYLTMFICKMFATEVFFGHIKPELWTWAPIIIFLPVAFIGLDSMKT